MEEGVFVTSKIRKEVLTGESQGRIILDGTVKRIAFKNLGCGVYKAYITSLY